MKIYLKSHTVSMAIILISGCLFFKSLAESEKPQKKLVQTLESGESFLKLIDTSGSRLLMFDLYADWCMPCRLLSPILDKIASEMSSSVSIYKINIDKYPEIASAFQVSGIPLVVLVKNKIAVQALMGVQPEAAYRRAILTHTGKEYVPEKKETADGEIVNGVRIIKLSTQTAINALYAYRGEDVKLIFDKVEMPFSVHIPAFNISKDAKNGENLIIDLKAKETGVYSILCNGKCISGDGQGFAKLVVLEYNTDSTKAVFKSITPREAQKLVESEKGKMLLLDVRTPNEFYNEYIEGATLIPLQQLAERINEISSYKNSTVLIYCRSGNRSIPASQILINNGFKKIFDMKDGITGWKREKLPVKNM